MKFGPSNKPKRYDNSIINHQFALPKSKSLIANRIPERIQPSQYCSQNYILSSMYSQQRISNLIKDRYLTYYYRNQWKKGSEKMKKNNQEIFSETKLVQRFINKKRVKEKGTESNSASKMSVPLNVHFKSHSPKKIEKVSNTQVIDSLNNIDSFFKDVDTHLQPSFEQKNDYREGYVRKTSSQIYNQNFKRKNQLRKYQQYRSSQENVFHRSNNRLAHRQLQLMGKQPKKMDKSTSPYKHQRNLYQKLLSKFHEEQEQKKRSETALKPEVVKASFHEPNEEIICYYKAKYEGRSDPTQNKHQLDFQIKAAIEPW